MTTAFCLHTEVHEFKIYDRLYISNLVKRALPIYKINKKTLKNFYLMIKFSRCLRLFQLNCENMDL